MISPHFKTNRVQLEELLDSNNYVQIQQFYPPPICAPFWKQYPANGSCPLLLGIPEAVTCEWNDKAACTDTYTLLSHEELMTVASPGKSKQDDNAWNTNDLTLIITIISKFPTWQNHTRFPQN